MWWARLANSPIRWLASPVLYGLENIPAERPLMFVGNHMLYGIFEVPILTTELHRQTGIVLRGMGDHLHFRVPGWRMLAELYGVVDGTPENCAQLLEQGECPLVFPGGAREVAKRRGERYNLDWGNRLGFTRLALSHGCTIIPVSAIGVDDAFEIWRDKDDLTARFADFLDKVGVRREILWPVPSKWHPERMYFKFGKPITTQRGDVTQSACERLREQVRAAVETGIDWLLKERERDPERGITDRVRRRIRAVASGSASAAQFFERTGGLKDVTPAGTLAAARAIRGTRLGPHTAVQLHAAIRPDKLAVIDSTRRLDWRGFDREIASLAGGLVGLGVSAGDRVAMVLTNSIEHACAQQACMRIGATAVPVGYRLTAPEIAYIIENSKPTALIYHAHLGEAVRGAHARAQVETLPKLVIVGGEDANSIRYEDLTRDGASIKLPRKTSRDAGGLMIYTSGTTGKPKGARRSYRDNGFEAIIDFMLNLGMSSEERHAIVCPLYHSGAFGFFSMMSVLGATTFFAEKFEPEEFLAAVQREKLTSAFLVPTMLTRILSLGDDVLNKYDTSSLKWIASGAAQLSPATARQFQERFGNILWNFYGATETGLVTLARPEDHDTRIGTIGRPLRGNKIKLLDDKGHEVPHGGIGELYVRNRMLIGGYHDNDKATKQSMNDGFFSVGDLARVDDDGYIYLESRKIDMIISGGVNIYPREIEDRIAEHPDVLECAVIGVPHDEWGESAVAFVVPRAGSKLDVDTITQHCREGLAKYKIPRTIQISSELPRNETGKVLKRVLRERCQTTAS
ncbi:MAG: AMP-binding protein [Kofleriaceae bacterium]